MIKIHYTDIAPYVTKDGSLIRELMHPQVHGNRMQSLAEALVPVNGATALHRHHQSEELYYISYGEGEMTLESHVFPVQAGDTICIAPGAAHCIRNTGTEVLRILCCSSPAYAHDDTELL
jgi:mannose-6-phosphate isomerase-like protein (cupin superfamily)